MTRRKLNLFFVLTLFLALARCENMLKFEDNTGIDNTGSLHVIMRRMAENTDGKDSVDPSEGSGDDDEDSNHISGSGEEESSGGSPYVTEGSGENGENTKMTTEKPQDTTHEGVIDINVGKTTKKPTTTKKKVTRKTTTMGNNVEVVTENPDNPNVAKTYDDEDDEEEGGISFTLGIVIGVVVGSILAVLIIVLLVYRLRKKDEGSYSLDDQSSTQFIRDPDSPQKGGKEYLA